MIQKILSLTFKCECQAFFIAVWLLLQELAKQGVYNNTPYRQSLILFHTFCHIKKDVPIPLAQFIPAVYDELQLLTPQAGCAFREKLRHCNSQSLAQEFQSGDRWIVRAVEKVLYRSP